MVRLNRKSDEHRKLLVKVGVVTKAKGSAYLEIGNTKVIVSVYEPKEISHQSEYCEVGNLFCDFKYASYIAHKSEINEKVYSNLMQTALQPAVCLQEYPNLQIDVCAMVLDDDGSALSACINCAGVAIANAAIPMFGIVASVTLGIQSNELFLDPDFKEEQICSYSLNDSHTDIEMCTEEEVEIEPDVIVEESKFKLNPKKSWIEIHTLVCKLLSNDRVQSPKKIKIEPPTNHVNEYGLITIANLGHQEQVSLMHQTGVLSLEQIERAINTLTNRSKDIIQVLEKTLVNFVLGNASNR